MCLSINGHIPVYEWVYAHLWTRLKHTITVTPRGKTFDDCLSTWHLLHEMCLSTFHVAPTYDKCHTVLRVMVMACDSNR